MTAPEQPLRQENFLDTIVGVFANPVPTLIGVVRSRPLANAFIVIIVLYIAQGLEWALSQPTNTLGDDDEVAAGFNILISPAFGIGLTALITGLYWLMIRILGGNGEYGALFAGVGFASAPSILTALFGFIDISLGYDSRAILEFVQFCVAIGVGIWTIILSVIVVRESAQFSTGRASAAVLASVPAIIVFVFVVLFVYDTSVTFLQDISP